MLHGVFLLERCVGGIASNRQNVFRTGQCRDSLIISFFQLGSNSTGQGLNGISFALRARPRLLTRPCCDAMVTLAFNLFIDSEGQWPSLSSIDHQTKQGSTKLHGCCQPRQHPEWPQASFRNSPWRPYGLD